jgi:hypothetical protein
MPDPVEDAARQWLTRFVGMYEGMDAGGTDPVHVARVRAQHCLNAGAKSSDPFTICGLMIEALPADERATTLATSWCQMYLEALQGLDEARHA